MNVSVDFGVETSSLFVLSYISIMYVYYCRCEAVVWGSGCYEKTVMSLVCEGM